MDKGGGVCGTDWAEEVCPDTEGAGWERREEVQERGKGVQGWRQGHHPVEQGV